MRATHAAPVASSHRVAFTQIVPQLGALAGNAARATAPTTAPTLPGIPEDTPAEPPAEALHKTDHVTGRKLACLFPATSPPAGEIPELAAQASSARQRTQVRFPSLFTSGSGSPQSQLSMHAFVLTSCGLIRWQGGTPPPAIAIATASAVAC